MKIVNLCLMIIIFLIASACQKDDKQYIIDNNLDYPIFHLPWIINAPEKFDIGLSTIIKRTYSYNKLISLDTCTLCLDAYISHDTIKLFYNNPDCFVLVNIFDSIYSISIDYSTDIAGTYPEDKKYRGTSISPRLNFDSLILKEDKLRLGDIIEGYIKIETRPYKRYDSNQSDKIEGPFIARIKDIKKRIKFMIP